MVITIFDKGNVVPITVEHNTSDIYIVDFKKYYLYYISANGSNYFCIKERKFYILDNIQLSLALPFECISIKIVICIFCLMF
jgi:hypothetical protein